MYILFFFLTLIVFSMLTLRRRGNVKSDTDFALAGRGLSAFGVCGVIVGTLVGGASTVGTVQLAYSHGITAWLFTLGSGLACLVLALVFSRPLRREHPATVSEYIGMTFGAKAQRYTSLFSSLGMFLQVVAQCLAGVAVLRASLPIGQSTSLAICFFLIFIFVVIGGMSGSKIIGQLKIGMLYCIMVISAVMAWIMGGGLGPVLERLPEGDWFNLFALGTSQGMTDMVSMIVGVCSTQIYLQAIFSARDVNEARKGALLAAAIIPPLGLLAVFIGIYLRGVCPVLPGGSASALPAFINTYYPGPIAAVFTAGLLIIALGTASGLLLGVSTSLYVDFLQRFSPLQRISSNLTRIRLCAVIVLMGSFLLVLTGLDSNILEWAFMAMGLRGAAVFPALCFIVLIGLPAIKPAFRGVLYLGPLAYVFLTLWLKTG